MKSKLKLVIIAPFYVPYPGGQEVHTMFLVKYLKELNVDITVITTNSPKMQRIEQEGNVKIVRLKRTFEVNNNPFVLELFSKLMKVQADIFHVQGYWSFFSNIGALVSKLRKIPIVFTSHGFQQFLYESNIFGKLFVLSYVHTVGRFMFKNLSGFTCNHIQSRDILKNIGVEEKKIRVIPSGLDIETYSKSEEGITQQDLEKFKQDLDIKGPILFYIGRLVARKGCHYLLKALPKVISKYPGLTLIVIGEGPEENYFKKLARDLKIEKNILFTGYLKPFSRTLISYYKIADVQILPSLTESMPVSIMEGMFFGNPIMVTDRHFAKWIHYKGEDLYIPLNPFNTNDFSKKLVSILENNTLRKSLSEKGKNFVKDTFDWRVIARRTYKYYLEVLIQHQKNIH